MVQKIKGHITFPINEAYGERPREGKVSVYTDGTLVVAAPPPTLRGNEHHVVVLKLTDENAMQLAAALTEIVPGLMKERMKEVEAVVEAAVASVQKGTAE